MIATIVSHFLKIFDSSTKIFCGVYYPTSSRVIPQLVCINNAFKKYSRFPIISLALNAMITKFKKYWESFPIVFCLASVMDPRYKFFAIGQWLIEMGIGKSEADRVELDLKEILEELYLFYKASPVVVH